jgi:3-methyl-2-oxobutanoate hydroxymethyltransferase
VEPVDDMKVRPEDLRKWKSAGRRVAALTAYDYPMARLLDEAGVPVLLVGDSLGMVVLGHPDTTHVTLADMEHHVRAVARARPRALVVADLPYRTYDDPLGAVEAGRALVDRWERRRSRRRADGRSCPQVRALVGAGIPFMGHLGMLPQHVLEEGGYRIKGRDEAQRVALLADALALEAAGAFAIVLELVTPPVAAEVSRALTIPTLGIGSGLECDGQILVTPDLLGSFPWFTPKFVRRRRELDARRRGGRSGSGWLRCAVGEISERRSAAGGRRRSCRERRESSGDGDAGIEVDVLDEVEELDALLHRALEGLAAGDEAAAAGALVDDGGLDRFGEVVAPEAPPLLMRPMRPM